MCIWNNFEHLYLSAVDKRNMIRQDKVLKQGKATIRYSLILQNYLNLQFTIDCICFKNSVISAIRAPSDKLSRVEQTYNLDLFTVIQVSCFSQKSLPLNLGKVWVLDEIRSDEALKILPKPWVFSPLSFLTIYNL